MKMNYKYLFFLPVCLFFHFNRIRYKEKCNNQIAEKEKIVYKQESALEVYKLWVNLYQSNKKITDYLIENNYHSIAIYGMGRIGIGLFEELSESKVTVDYVIDRWLSVSEGRYKSVLCYNPDAILPRTDLIIISVSSESDEIALYLSGCGSPIISIQDLLRSLNRTSSAVKCCEF